MDARIAMSVFDPACEEIMDLYRNDVSARNRWSHYLHRLKLSDFFHAELLALLGDPAATAVVASVLRISNFSNEFQPREQQRALAEMLAKDYGMKGKRGKRSNAGLSALVKKMTPMLLYYGLPDAISERSKLVRALRLMADEVGVKGDPRNELRRLQRLEDELHTIRKESRREMDQRIWAILADTDFSQEPRI